MADITGGVYEAFVGYLLHRIGYRDEWTPGIGREYRFGSHSEATCHRGGAACRHAQECNKHSALEKLPRGPWYDPDFFIVDGESPAACIHITHWSNPSSSQYKFWRTMEDHLQYKTHYGRQFISVNALFVALDRGVKPRKVVDSDDRIDLHGWKPATGATLAVSFDSSLIFPIDYEPLSAVLSHLPNSMPRVPRRRREAYRAAFDSLIASDREVAIEVSDVTELLRSCVESMPNPRYSATAIEALQSRCWAGRQRAVGLTDTSSRYRKGVQHAFLLSEVVASVTESSMPADAIVAAVAQSLPRFPATELPRVLGLSTAPAELDTSLALIPVRIDNGAYIPLLNRAAGAGQYDWNPDLKQFVLAVRALSASARNSLLSSLQELFREYRSAYGMSYVVADLSNASRICAKVAYVRENLIGHESKTDFVQAFVEGVDSFSQVVEDVHTWPVELLLEAYALGSMQHVTTTLPAAFEAKTGQSLRPYAYMGDLGRLVSHLIAGVKVGQYFSSRAALCEEEFLRIIWPLFAECIWGEFIGREPCDDEFLKLRYRYKKAMRIISSPDLEPVSFLFRRSFPGLASGPLLRGAFNQLSTAKGWGRTALTTATAGFAPESFAVIHTQSVFGGKHIADKTKELSARMRANHLTYHSDGTFGPEMTPGVHYLVVDGDWPIEAKVNLLESGFTGVFELGDLASLRSELAALPRTPTEHSK